VVICVNSLVNFSENLLSKYYFPFIWFGFILFVDGLVYRFRGRSLIKNNFKNFISLFLVSLLFWFIFEVISSEPVQGWFYIKLYEFSYSEYLILSSIVFSFVLPTIFEVTDLISILTSFKFKTKKLKPTKRFLYLLILLGLTSLVIPIFIPELTFPLIWISLFLIFDPINYLNKQPSIIRSIVESDWEMPSSLLVSGVICGFFWEFWNFWSYPKWSRNIPFFDFYRSFDISMSGYLFYFFFSWELFAMYHFARSIGKSYLPRLVNFIKGMAPKGNSG